MRNLFIGAILGGLGLGLTACATQASDVDPVCLNLPAGDICAYDADRNAAEDVDVAMDLAAEEGLKTMIVMGGNWCHDSRALAGHFDKARFASLIAEHYSLVYVDVGRKNRNIDIAQRFGLDSIVGTPTVIITDSDGAVLNLDTAPTWRNAASRTEDEIYEYFERFALME
jgi:thiol-disulfide isomerase/thioredoxin